MPISEKSDMNRIGAEALDHLQSLIKIDTTNPPGGETAACEYIRQKLSAENIPSEILEKTQGRGNVVSRIKGDGSRKPLLLQGHVDVVTAEADKWSHPPFAAEIADGYLYGRGAIDMKNMVAMELTAMLVAKRANWPLKRDLIFAAVADEEAGCEFGSKYLVENFPDKVSAEYALGEIGGFSIDINKTPFWPIGVAEKGVVWIKVKTTGTPGHGAMPNPDNAVVKIAHAASRIGGATLPLHVTEVTQSFLEAMAGAQSKPVQKILGQLTNPLLSNLIINRLISDKAAAKNIYAGLHNTANVTMLIAGEKINVVPGTAEMRVDGRILPGQTAEDFLKEIKKVLGKGYEIEVINSMPPILTDMSDPAFGVLKNVIKQHDPDGIPIPNLVPGFTDAKFFSKTGAKCFGFSPIKFNTGEKFAELFHGHNERIPVDGFKKGVAILLDAIYELAC